MSNPTETPAPVTVSITEPAATMTFSPPPVVPGDSNAPVAPRKRSVFSEMLRPFGQIGRGAALKLVIGQALIALALWTFAPTAIPTPGEVFAALQTLVAEQGLVGHLYTSLILNLEAIALTTAISFTIAYATVIPVVRPVGAFLSALRFTSMVGFTFVFTLMAASAHGLKLYLLVFGMSVFLIPAVMDFVNDNSPERRDRLNHARTLRMGPLRVLWEVVILGNSDKAIDALRNVAAMGWLMLTLVEGLVRSEGGLGVILLNQNKYFNLAAVFAIQLVVLATGLTIDYLFGLLKNAVAPQSNLAAEKK